MPLTNPDKGDQAADFLRSQGIDVVDVSQAGEINDATKVVDQSAIPTRSTSWWMSCKFAPTRFIQNYQPDRDVDIILTIGNDWQAP